MLRFNGPALVLLSPLALLCVAFFAACAGGGKNFESQLPEVQQEKLTPLVMLKSGVRLYQRMVTPGTHSRRKHRPMNPTYITVHATENPTGDAWAHAKALQRGAISSSWHFTVQQDCAIQHLPTNIQGRHADMEGPGNHNSIGIEMCEHRGNNIAQTIDRTARLCAFLMYANRIPLSRVVPHYHWPRPGMRPPNKNCPAFLLDGGRPGAKWRWFLSRVDSHYKRIGPGPIPRI